MNIQSMMMQAKKLQKELEKTTKELEETTYTYENDNLLIECLGNNSVKKIKIKNEDILEDTEMLEDIILVGINNVLNQILEDKEKKLGKYTNGLGGLF